MESGEDIVYVRSTDSTHGNDQHSRTNHQKHYSSPMTSIGSEQEFAHIIERLDKTSTEYNIIGDIHK